MGMKLTVDRNRCAGHGLCEEAAPQLLHLDDEGKCVIDVEDIEEKDLEAAKMAVRVCPVIALTLT